MAGLLQIAVRARAAFPVLLGILSLLLPVNVRGAESTNPVRAPKPARLKISGYGILGNRELKRTLVTLELSGKRPEHFAASFIEDAALILTARVKRDGFLEPQITIDLGLEQGGSLEVTAKDLLENPLPRPLRVTSAHFKIRKGVLYYFKQLRFEGLATIPRKQALSYFVETDSLLKLKQSRVFTPERLRRGIFSLTDMLDREGYQNATAEATQVETNRLTGAVNAVIKVQQGYKYMVRSLREEFFPQGATEPQRIHVVEPNRPYSRLWVQDTTLALKTNEYARGFPDTTVTFRELSRATNSANTVALQLAAEIKTGLQIRIGSVQFQGEKRTRQSLMARRVRVRRGDLLDPSRVEQGRYRLAQLGIFDTVDLSYKPEDDHTRDVIYRVKEGKRLSVNLLFGYGSYELLRGGAEVDLANIWGLAHRARLKAIQSFKSTSGEFTYTIPELIGRGIDLFFQGFGLRREEISFTRQEYGGGLGTHKYFKDYATDVSVRYNYQVLNAADLFTPVASEGLTNPAVGAIITDIRFDRRNNPLYPTSGYKLFTSLELGSSYLGGEANYQRVALSPSYHLPLWGGTYLSFGVSHGVDISFGSPADNLPFNRRFFPGGDNSIRGYKEGEASPRNAQGEYIGAETYTLGTVEIEQSLTPKWSMVLFSDSLGFAQRLENYPWDTALFSVGGGIRWKSIIGPVRLEYGYNLNPRPGDPTGTLLFSLGFPF